MEEFLFFWGILESYPTKYLPQERWGKGDLPLPMLFAKLIAV